MLNPEQMRDLAEKAGACEEHERRIFAKGVAAGLAEAGFMLGGYQVDVRDAERVARQEGHRR